MNSYQRVVWITLLVALFAILLLATPAHGRHADDDETSKHDTKHQSKHDSDNKSDEKHHEKHKDDTHHSRSSLEHSIDKRDEEIHSLKKSLDHRKETVDELKDSLDSREKKIQKLKDERDEAEEKAHERKKEVKTMQKEKDAIEKDEKKLDKREEKVENRRSKVKKTENELEKEEDEIEHERKKLYRLRDQIREREKNVTKREHALAELDAQRENFYYKTYAKPYEKYWMGQNETDQDDSQYDNHKHTKHHVHHHTKHHVDHHVGRTSEEQGATVQIPQTGYEAYYEQHLPQPMNTTSDTATDTSASTLDITPDAVATTSLSSMASEYQNPANDYSAQPEIDASSELSSRMQAPYKAFYARYSPPAASSYDLKQREKKHRPVEPTEDVNRTQAHSQTPHPPTGPTGQPTGGEQGGKQEQQSSTDQSMKQQPRINRTRYGRLEGKPHRSYPKHSKQEELPLWADESLPMEERNEAFRQAQRRELERQREIAGLKGHSHLHGDTDKKAAERDYSKHGKHEFRYEDDDDGDSNSSAAARFGLMSESGNVIINLSESGDRHHHHEHEHDREPQGDYMRDEREVVSHVRHEEVSGSQEGSVVPIGIIPPIPPQRHHHGHEKDEQNEHGDKEEQPAAGGDQKEEQQNSTHSLVLAEKHKSDHKHHDEKHEKKHEMNQKGGANEEQYDDTGKHHKKYAPHTKVHHHDIRKVVREELEMSIAEREARPRAMEEQQREHQQQQQPQQQQQQPQQPQQGHEQEYEPHHDHKHRRSAAELIHVAMPMNAIEPVQEGSDLPPSVSVWMTLLLLVFVLIGLWCAMYGRDKYQEWKMLPRGAYKDAEPLIKPAQPAANGTTKPIVEQLNGAGAHFSQVQYQTV